MAKFAFRPLALSFQERKAEQRVVELLNKHLRLFATGDPTARIEEQVATAVDAMAKVAGSAEAVDGVIEGLDKIAFQTRVLAMNAAVLSGRAAEAGRGFAVVADLVSRSEEEARRARRSRKRRSASRRVSAKSLSREVTDLQHQASAFTIEA